jgi:hypothetical protein
MTKVTCDKIHSRLESTLSGEGHALCIATCRADADWILELEDELGRSTLLDARSASDQAAEDAALAEIEGVGGLHRLFDNVHAQAWASQAEFFVKLGAVSKSLSMASAKVGPNEPCPCGQKYKKCCGSSADLY